MDIEEYKMLPMYDLRYSDPTINVLYLFLHTSFMMGKIREESFMEENLNLSQFRLLIILTQHDRPLTPGEIGRCLSRESQTITNTLNQLEKKGFIEKVKDQSDKRKARIQITESGKQVIIEQIQWLAQSASEMVSCFSADELKQIEGYLTRWREWIFKLLGIDLVKPMEGFSDTFGSVDKNLSKNR